MTVNPYQAPAADLTSGQQQQQRAAPALWNPDAVGNWSLFFTPIFGAVLISRNWQALNDARRASRARIWAYIAPPIVLVGGAFPLLIVWYFASNRPQARYVKERWGSDYPRQPWSQPLGMGVLIWLGLMAGFVALYMGLAVLLPARP